MSIYPDIAIRRLVEQGEIRIEPYDPKLVQPASYDVTLDNEFMVFKTPLLASLYRLLNLRRHAIDPKQDNSRHMQRTVVPKGQPFVLKPHQMALGATVQKIGVGINTACDLGGKSSLARLGLMVHVTAGFIDPGNYLKITFEFYNLSRWQSILLWPGMKAGQLFFSPLTEACEVPYGSAGLGSKYYGADGVQPSRMHLNFNNGG